MLQQLNEHQDIADSPLGKQFMQILQSGDEAAGEQLANNLLKTFGSNRQEALKLANQRWGKQF